MLVMFSRSAVQSILNIGQNEITITGDLTDGNAFEGTTEIRLINKGKN